MGLIAQGGNEAPGAGGAAFFTDFGGVSLNNSGDVAFSAVLQEGEGGSVIGSSNESAIFGPTSGPGSSLGLVLLQGGPVPNVPGATFGEFESGPEGLNDAGELAVDVEISTSEGDTQVIFGPTSGTGSPLGIIAQGGEPAPGAPGSTFDNEFGNPRQCCGRSGFHGYFGWNGGLS